MLRSSLAAGFACLSLLIGGRAWADPAAAEALFREGHRLLEEGRYEEAAQKLAESQAQDPASGTLINLALAYEKWGRLATAWATYQDAALLARRDGRSDRVLTAERKRNELEPRVPRLTFRADAPPEGLALAWGRVRIGIGALGSPIPIDPGEYRLTASAPGRKSWEVELRVSEGQRSVITVPELEPIAATEASTPVTPPAGANVTPSAASVTPSSPGPNPSRRELSPQERGERSKALPIALGASGLAALGVGAWFGARALSRYHAAEQACPSHTGCGDAALEDWRAARSSAWISNVGVGVGLAACAASAWLFFGTRSTQANDVAVAVSPLSSGAAFSVRARL